MAREVKMPSGATLKVNEAPIGEAKALYQAMARELRQVSVQGGVDYNSLLKELFCIGLSSPAIEAVLLPCMARCTYDYGGGDMKLELASFERHDQRQDYIPACMEVVKENVGPFLKSLSVEFAGAMAMILGFRMSKPQTTTS